MTGEYNDVIHPTWVEEKVWGPIPIDYPSIFTGQPTPQFKRSLWQRIINAFRLKHTKQHKRGMTREQITGKSKSEPFVWKIQNGAVVYDFDKKVLEIKGTGDAGQSITMTISGQFQSSMISVNNNICDRGLYSNE